MLIIILILIIVIVFLSIRLFTISEKLKISTDSLPHTMI